MALANRLVAALATPERAALLALCDVVELKLHAQLTTAGQTPEHVWFPVEGMVSVSVPSPGAPDTEVALVGNEGMFPTALASGVLSTAFGCRVQVAGRAFQLSPAALQQALQAQAGLRSVLHRYVDVRLSQMAQQALCLHRHAVMRRLARSLLMTRDRVHSAELFLTHEVISRMLGVRRESVTHAAGWLAQRGIISYSRGYVILLDEAALQQMACPCLEADLLTYARAFPPVGAG